MARFHGISISVEEDGRWLASGEVQIPKEAEAFIVSASLHEKFVATPQRDRGIYRKDDTNAELDDWKAYDRKGAPPSYWVKITGNHPKEVIELYRAIRAGTIRPTESWESPQSGLSAGDTE